MPRYYYHCNNCHGDFFAHHMMDEKQKDCSLCESVDISKLLTKPLFFEKKNEKSKTGEITKQYIEDNRKVLKDLKEETKSMNYDKT
jgi:putative FmdB family regulatory protein|tara:strand:- start:6684 stop:6941 length:258 start_codon:yes stop_codon:yes gene_type:complete